MKDAEHGNMLDLLPSHHGIVQCIPAADGRCITCADEALTAIVVRADQDKGVALVSVQETTEEIDITLIDTPVPGDQVLVHGGVAIALLTEASHER